MKTKLALALVLAMPTLSFATEDFVKEPIKTTRSEKWARIELLEDKNAMFVREPFVPSCRREVPEVKEAFGDAEPPSSLFLLHMYEGWDRAQDPRPPVLLVHGAVVDATRSFGAGGFQGRAGDGLAARLASSGRRVFAITFAHPHGDNWLASEHVANAIARVKTLTGARAVDVIAHSKGGTAVRLYASNLRKPGMTAYRGDIHRILFVGCPNDGIDVAFAYPNLSYFIIAKNGSGPVVFTEALVYGVWTDLRERSIYAGGAFPGQAQMLKRWDGIYGLYRGDDAQFDLETTYKGGRGQVSRSLGIDKAIKDGGDLVAKLEKTGLDKRIEVALLAGSKPAMLGYTGERRGPSDGIVLVRSALATDGLAKNGAQVLRKDVLHLSHIELVYAEPALKWIEEALAP